MLEQIFFVCFVIFSEMKIPDKYNAQQDSSFSSQVNNNHFQFNEKTYSEKFKLLYSLL